jgi:large subunit ribosomal protein L10
LTVGLNLNDKKAAVAEFGAQLAASETVVLAEYRGIRVGDMTTLRVRAREEGVYLRVLKNTLARRAVEGTIFSDLASEMTGPLIYSMSGDAVAAARILHEFARTNDRLVIKCGSFAGRSLDRAEVIALASIPSREILLSQLLGMMQAPVSAFARALAALAEKKENPA